MVEEQQAPDLAFYKLGYGLERKKTYETLNPESKRMMVSKPQIHHPSRSNTMFPCADKQGPSAPLDLLKWQVDPGCFC